MLSRRIFRYPGLALHPEPIIPPPTPYPVSPEPSVEVVSRKRFIYQALCFCPIVIAPAAEDITLDKWHGTTARPPAVSRLIKTDTAFVPAPIAPLGQGATDPRWPERVARKAPQIPVAFTAPIIPPQGQASVDPKFPERVSRKAPQIPVAFTAPIIPPEIRPATDPRWPVRGLKAPRVPDSFVTVVAAPAEEVTLDKWAGSDARPKRKQDEPKAPVQEPLSGITAPALGEVPEQFVCFVPRQFRFIPALPIEPLEVIEAPAEEVISGGHFLPKKGGGKKKRKQVEAPAAVYIFPPKAPEPKTELKAEPEPVAPIASVAPVAAPPVPSGPTISELQAQMLKIEYDLALAQKAQQQILHQWIAKDLTNKLAKQRLWEARQEEIRLLAILESFKEAQRKADDELLVSMMLLL